MSTVKKERNVYRGVVVWMIVLLLLCALAAGGYIYTKKYLASKQNLNEKEAIEINNERIEEYNAAVMELRRETAVTETKEWPAAASTGYDVVDLTAYPISSGYTAYVTRQEMLSGGLLVINRWHAMPADLTDDMMVSINRYSRQDEDTKNNIPTTNSSLTLQTIAVEALMDMYTDARNEGLDMDGIIVSDAYRTMEEQTSKWNKKVESLSAKYSGEKLTEQALKTTAYPGNSDYQSGLSVFIYNYKKNDNEFTSTKLHDTEQGKWIYNNCWKYGFVFRFPVQGFPYEDSVDKSYKTGIASEMKTYRYVGKANAAVMNALGLCLEEYVEYLMAHPHIALYYDGVLQYEIYRTEGGYADTQVTIPNGAVDYSVSTDNMNGLVVAASFI